MHARARERRRGRNGKVDPRISATRRVPLNSRALGNVGNGLVRLLRSCCRLHQGNAIGAELPTPPPFVDPLVGFEGPTWWRTHLLDFTQASC
jgi:hypothetical protein